MLYWYFYVVSAMLFLKYCPLGWVDFAFFLNFMKSHGFAFPLVTIWGTVGTKIDIEDTIS